MNRAVRLHAIRNRILDIEDRRPLDASEQRTLDRVHAELDRRAVRVIRWERAQAQPFMERLADLEKAVTEAVERSAKTGET